MVVRLALELQEVGSHQMATRVKLRTQVRMEETDVDKFGERVESTPAEPSRPA